MKLFPWSHPRIIVKYLCLFSVLVLLVFLSFSSREDFEVKRISLQSMVSFQSGFKLNSLLKPQYRMNRYSSFNKSFSNIKYDNAKQKEHILFPKSDPAFQYNLKSRVRKPKTRNAHHRIVNAKSQDLEKYGSDAIDISIGKNRIDFYGTKESSSYTERNTSGQIYKTIDNNSNPKAAALTFIEPASNKTVHRHGVKYDEDQGQDERYGTMKLQDEDMEPFVVDGIYWSEAVEKCIPKGISEEEADQWLTSFHSLPVHFVRAATWNRCGGNPNAFVTLRDGTSLCARYRPSSVSLVLGEVLSYWLSRLLGLDCVPPVALTSSESLLRQKPRDFHSQRLDWRAGETVALIRWVDRMDSSPNTKVLMPRRILKAYRSGQPITMKNLEQGAASHSNSQNKRNFSLKRETNESRPDPASNAHVDREMGELQMEDLVMLAQWGTMIVFDYLTGNYDRVASMQDGAEQENNTRILEESIRNLRPSDRGVKLWLIDNECGLLDAYTVLYLKSVKSSKFIDYHERMLRTMCIFQRNVVRALQDLHKEREPHQFLVRYATKRDNLINRIERDESFQLFQENFPDRLNNVVQWIQFCHEKTNSKTP